jgi:hypothetical protein
MFHLARRIPTSAKAADAACTAKGLATTGIATMARGKAVALRVAGLPPFWTKPICASS